MKTAGHLKFLPVLFALSFMKTAGYLKFLPVLYHFENRRLFEVSASSLPFRKPQVIWGFCQFFTVSRTAGYLKFLK